MRQFGAAVENYSGWWGDVGSLGRRGERAQRGHMSRGAHSFLAQTHERQPSWAFCTRVCKTTGHFLAVTVLRNGYRANKYQTTPNINSTRCFSERFSRAAGLAWMCYLFARRHRVSIRSQKFPSHKNKLVIFMTSRRCCKISISRGPWWWIRGLWKWVGI